MNTRNFGNSRLTYKQDFPCVPQIVPERLDKIDALSQAALGKEGMRRPRFGCVLMQFQHRQTTAIEIKNFHMWRGWDGAPAKQNNMQLLLKGIRVYLQRKMNR